MSDLQYITVSAKTSVTVSQLSDYTANTGVIAKGQLSDIWVS